MRELDYYTVMEKKIRYYAEKYDPYGRLEEKKPLPEVTLIPNTSTVKPRSRTKERVFAGFSQVMALFF